MTSRGSARTDPPAPDLAPSPVSAETRALQRRAHALIPGGAHTYAKGDDQYPFEAPPFIRRGQGCHVWDLDGREFIEYGMGLRAVTLGHAHPAVVAAVERSLRDGSNFTRPAPIEVACAEALLALLPAADMVKFCKNASDATTAAVKLARAATGRDPVAICGDQPFLSVDDWFIGSTAMPAGIPDCVRALTRCFRYGDLDDLRRCLDAGPAVACVVMEAETTSPPPAGYLEGVQRLCRERGIVFVLDETITGFRWHTGGAQALYGLAPDLSVFGKGLANGFSVSALAGRRDLMERGGLEHRGERVWLLSTTHGAETHALAACIETIRIYREEPVVETLHARGEALRSGLAQVATRHGVAGHVEPAGRACNLLFATRNREGQPDQAYRTLFLQELVRRGVLGPSLVTSHAHTEQDVERTVEALDGACAVYARALDDGPERHLVGPPSKRVFRPFN